MSDLTSIFYPTSPSRVVDPDDGAARFAKKYSHSLDFNIVMEFIDIIIERTLTQPEDVDSLVQAALLIDNESLPIFKWPGYGEETTFDECFGIGFRDTIHGNLTISETSETSALAEFLHGSFIAGRARSLRLMTSPETVGAVGEGLKFPDEVIFHSTGEIAEIRALGACLQLLGSASTLNEEYYGERFAVEKVVKFLEGIPVSAPDKPLVDLTIRHLQSTPLKDMTSSEIVQSTRAAGWNRLWVGLAA